MFTGNFFVSKTCWILLQCVLTLGLLSGCVSPRFLDGQEHTFRELALVMDATVVNARLGAPAQINAASDNVLAAQMEVVVNEVLGSKGYLPIPMIRTTGLGFSSAQPLEVVIDMSAPHFGPPNLPPYSALIRAPGVNVFQVGALHNHPADSRFVIPSPENGRPLPVMVVTIRGKSASGEVMPFNAARGSSNIILSPGARDAESWTTYDSDTLSISVSLLEGGSGKLLWQEQRKVAAEPVVRNYAGELREMLQQFPVRKAL